MPKHERLSIMRYVVAIFAAAFATLLRYILGPALGEETPFIFHFPAIVVSAWFGGRGPGLLTTGLSALAAWFLFIPPHNTLIAPKTSGAAALSIFILAGVLLSLLAESLHRARRQTEAQHEQLRVTLSSIGDAVIATDAHGSVTFMNDVAVKMIGWTLEAAENRPLKEVFNIVNEHSRYEVENPVARVLREGVIVGLANHTVLISRDGTEKPIDDSGAPIRNAEGEIIGAVLVFRDITEKRRAEEELHKVQERFQGIYESSKDAILFADLDGRLVDVNDAFCDLTGYSREELMQGRRFQDLTPAEYHQLEAGMVEKLIRTGVSVRYEKEYMRKDGSRVPLEIVRFRVTGKDGSPAGIAGIIRDISKRKQAEEALRRSEETFRTLADSAPVMIWKSGLDKLCNFFNKPWLDFTGRTMEQEMGNGWVVGVHPDDFERCLATYMTSFDARRDFSMEYRLRRFDGVYRWVLDSAVPLYGPDREFTGYIGSCIDITERKQAEAAREEILSREQEARSQAEEANRLKDEFLATVSHELRTPLTAMLGWTKMLRSGRLREEKRGEALEIIERNARAQAQLVEDLLDVSRIVSGKVRLDVRPVMAASVIESALNSVTPAAEAKGVRLLSALDPNAGPVSGDSARLQQVVWNLLSNAIKFTPRGGRVQVTLERIGSHAEIKVSDTGQGINPEFLPHVFDRFRQAQGGTTREHGGLGLGLAIVRHLVELHGGSVQADSDGEGKGATFTVRLPLMAVKLRTDDEERAHPRVDSRKPLSFANSLVLNGVRVLVIDDEFDTRALLKEVLEGCGAEVRDAGSASQGFEEAKEWKPAVVISDIGMPGEDGYAFIRKLREWEKGTGVWTPAVALTAYARSEDRIRALSAGYQIHIAKPVEPMELALVVAGLVGGGIKGDA